MSTRANILFKDEWGDELWFYRHSDGYPKGVKPTLSKFVDWVVDGKIRDNISQACGWLILLGAKEYSVYWDIDTSETKEKPTMFEPSGNVLSSWKCGAYEPTTQQHGDIEFLYTVDFKERTVTVKGLYGAKQEFVYSFEEYRQ